jgi:hypothetical protein
MLGVIMAIDGATKGTNAFTRGVCIVACICWFIAAAWQFFLLGRLLILFKATGVGSPIQANTGYAQAQ